LDCPAKSRGIRQLRGVGWTVPVEISDWTEVSVSAGKGIGELRVRSENGPLYGALW